MEKIYQTELGIGEAIEDCKKRISFPMTVYELKYCFYTSVSPYDSRRIKELKR